jgi:Tol biopolymer transport system component
MSERLQMFLADADGSDAHALTSDLVAPDWFDLSPDDRTAVVHTGARSHERLELVDLTTVSTPRPIDLGRPLAATFPNFLAPTGDEIVFRGIDGGASGIYAVHRDGTGLRALTRTDGSVDEFQFPQPSQDGRYLSYTSWAPRAGQLQLHVVDLVSGTDAVVDPVVGPSEGYAVFSPDGRRLVVNGYDGDQRMILVAPIDGGPALQMGIAYPDDHDVVGIFSPDGRWVLVQDNTTPEARLVDASTGGPGEVLDWSGDGVTGWQRLAP